MKRNDDSRLIKVPDATTVAAMSSGIQSTQASIASVFPQQMVSNVPGGGAGPGGGSVPQLPIQAHRAGVTVYRGDPSGSATLPPAAHTGVVVTATPASGGPTTQPSVSVMHGGSSQNVGPQPPGNIKPEPISLPTAPVSLQYANTFPSGGQMSSNSGPPAAVKTLANSLPGSMGSTVQSIVHNLQQQHQQQQQQQAVTTIHQVVHAKPTLVHQNVNFNTQATLRTIASATPHQTVSSLPITTSGNLIGSGGVLTTQGMNTNPGLGSNSSNSANFQRLKVEDALSYLDQVKFKFGNQPQVYNDFLDIMKEFKSQSIDTPGVIARVSSLFRGHPELIVGFNTFLPPGYKIEVHSNDSIAVSMPGIVGSTVQTIVHTPHGVHKMTTHGSGPLTTVTTSNQQHLQQMAAAQQLTLNQQQGNIIRTPLPTMATPPTITATPLNTPKFHPQPQLGVKLTDSSNSNSAGYHPGVGHPILGVNPHLPTTPLLQGASPIPISNANQPVTQVRHLLPPQGLPQAAQVTTPQPQGTNPPNQGTATQPVEFNHAINYVNKIKNRFQGQPDVYKQFLEILHTYQKDQKAIKEGHRPTGPYLTEAEVYGQVAKLFQNQEDLLAEFGQFLPEATGENSMMSKGLNNEHSNMAKKSPSIGGNFKFGSPKFGITIPGLPSSGPIGSPSGPPASSIKRPPSGVTHPPPKKQKTGVLRDVSLAEAGKYGTLNEYAFFDKVRKALRNPEVYDNFLRCLVLFNQEVISRGELVQLTTPFLSRHPELFKWFKDFVGYRDGPGANSGTNMGVGGPSSEPGSHHGGRPGVGIKDEKSRNDSEPGTRERLSGDSAMEIDYATCKRFGASYCALPKNFVQPSCSGRTMLCREVLNDTWVSFPSWSEDSQFVTSRKTQYEEAIYRTEDERFEFDVVLETNKDTIEVLECVQKKMSRMPPEEAARYRLDDCLGGTSSTIHQRAIRRIYGDKSADIIEGLKRNPVVAVPLVLRRLRAKDEEWREVQKNFNKVWRDQNEKYYLKSLDHQSLMFKQSDIRNLRSKSLLNEIESLFDERHEQNEDQENGAGPHPPTQEGPHINLTYTDMSILDDANNLLIHHVKRQTSIHKEDKHKIKVLLKQFLMDRFKHPRQEMSDDEREEDEQSGKEDEGGESETSKSARSERSRKRQKEEGKSGGTSKGGKNASNDDDKNAESSKEKEICESDIKVESKDGRRTPLHARDMEPDESYTLFMGNNNWYLFLRLHQILCDRLTKMYNQAVVIANEETKDKKDRKESTAVALRLKPKNEIEPEDYYPTFLDMVKNLLDGNMESQAYEDTLREMFGIHAYISFTLDKVVGNAVRQLQHLVTDESCVECYDLFASESKSHGTGGTCGTAVDRQVAELIYQKKAEKILADENCMKIILYHQSGVLTFELIDTETDGQDSEKENEIDRKYQSYIDRFIGPGDEISTECRSHLLTRPVFLPRSIRSYKKSRASQQVRASRQKNPDEGIAEDVESSGNRKDSQSNHLLNPNSISGNTENDRLSVKKEDVVYDDNSQCQFNLRNFKILYIVNSENCFYRRMALKRAAETHKSVSRTKSSDFSRWHAGWVRQNVTDSQHQTIDQWFMGKSDDLVANRTQKLPRPFFEKTPYRLYHKWVVDLHKNNPVNPVAPTLSNTS